MPFSKVDHSIIDLTQYDLRVLNNFNREPSQVAHKQ